MGFIGFMGVRGFRVCTLNVCNSGFWVPNTLIKLHGLGAQTQGYKPSGYKGHLPEFGLVRSGFLVPVWVSVQHCLSLSLRLFVLPRSLSLSLSRGLRGNCPLWLASRQSWYEGKVPCMGSFQNAGSPLGEPKLRFPQQIRRFKGDPPCSKNYQYSFPHSPRREWQATLNNIILPRRHAHKPLKKVAYSCIEHFCFIEYMDTF